MNQISSISRHAHGRDQECDPGAGQVSVEMRSQTACRSRFYGREMKKNDILKKSATSNAKEASARAQSGVETRKIGSLLPDSRNANKGTERGQQMIENSLRNFGAGRSILLDKHGAIIAGNKTVENAGGIGLEDVIVVQTDGTKLVAVQRMDLDLATDERAKGLAIADNRAGQVLLEWDGEVLASLAGELDMGQFFTAEEFAKLTGAPVGNELVGCVG
jgi:hypothetical protein